MKKIAIAPGPPNTALTSKSQAQTQYQINFYRNWNQ